MEEWKEYKLGDVCSIVGRIGFRGYTTDDLTNDPKDGAISLSPTNIVAGELDLSKPTYIKWPKYYESPEIMLEQGDIVLVKTGSSIGRTTRLREVKHPMTLNPQFVVLKNIKVDNVFLSYVIKSPYFQALLKTITVGSAIPTLSQKNLANLSIKLPERKIQEEVARVLSSLDDKIEVNRRINDNLEQQAQALFKSWFVDFEPFKDGEFVESELGMIPKGWRVGTLSELLDIKYGKDHKKLKDGNVPVYGSGGIMRKVEKPLYSGESVLIPRKGTLNNVIYVNEDFWTVDTMFYSIPKVNNVALFTYLFLLGKDLASMNAGSAVPSMTTEILNNMLIVIPGFDALESFNSICSSVFRIIKHNEQESSRLSSLRDTLLPRLMSGELKINDISV